MRARCDAATVSSHGEAVSRFSLIPAADALPAVEAALNQEDASDADLGTLAAVALGYVQASRLLLRYAVAVGGRPSRN